MRAARWTTPSLRLRSVVTGTSQLPAPFEPNPTLLRPPLPSQCPTESTEVILPHPVFYYVTSTSWFFHSNMKTRSLLQQSGLRMSQSFICLRSYLFCPLQRSTWGQYHDSCNDSRIESAKTKVWDEIAKTTEDRRVLRHKKRRLLSKCDHTWKRNWMLGDGSVLN